MTPRDPAQPPTQPPAEPPAQLPQPPTARTRRGLARAVLVLVVVAAIAALASLLNTSSNPETTAAAVRTLPNGPGHPGQPPPTARKHPRTYYVAGWGRDRYRGTDPRYPWRTLTRVNRARLRPGDRVLFRAGEVFADSALMPGGGDLVSGLPGAPITFGSYGQGRAVIPQGIFLGHSPSYPNGPSHLAFTDLSLGPDNGVQATGSYIALTRLHISGIVHANHQNQTGIRTQGSHWVIAGNSIDGTGDSGMLLGFDAGHPGVPAGGSDYTVRNNVIDHTGLDPTLRGTHGIYLKVAHATIAHNRILNFHDNGVSVRYRDARILDNEISHGSIGIAWFQYDTTPGTSEFIGNTITNTSSAAIFVCGAALGCGQPLETFVIRRNRLRDVFGVRMNLMRTSGGYRVRDNAG